MQCKAAKTKSSRCGGLSGKISEPSIVAQTHAAGSFAEAFWLVLFSLQAKFLYCCIPLVMTELTAVMVAASTMTLESRIFKWISSFLKRNNKSLNVYLSWRLSAVHGFAHGDPCSLHFWMSCYAESFWANEQSVAQQSPTVSKHLDCWQVLLHLHFLLPSHCTAHVIGHVLVHNKSTIAKGLMHVTKVRW